MTRPITPGDDVPTSPPLEVIAVEKRTDGDHLQLRITVDLPADHPLHQRIADDGQQGYVGDITALLGTPGAPAEDDDEDPHGLPDPAGMALTELFAEAAAHRARAAGDADPLRCCPLLRHRAADFIGARIEDLGDALAAAANRLADRIAGKECHQ
jgi:hypothetical protein